MALPGGHLPRDRCLSNKTFQIGEIEVPPAGKSVALLRGVRGAIIILQNPHAGAIQIIKLATVHRTKKNP
jgi:hypothetical protein